MISKRRKTATLRKKLKKCSNHNIRLNKTQIGAAGDHPLNTSSVKDGVKIKENNEKIKKYLELGFTVEQLLWISIVEKKSPMFRITDILRIKNELNPSTNENQDIEQIKIEICTKLKDKDIPINDLINMGFWSDILIKIGFDHVELINAGVLYYEFIDVYNNVRTLMSVGKHSLTDIIEIFKVPLSKLKEEGFTANVLKETNKVSIKDLLYAKYTTSEIIHAGFTAKELLISKVKLELTPQLLKESGKFTDQDIITSGFYAKELKESKLFNDEDILGAGLDPWNLKTAGFLAGDIINRKFTYYSNENTELTARQLNQNDFTLQQLVESKKTPFTLDELKTAGYNLIDNDNYNLSHIFESGKYTYSDITRIYKLYDSEHNLRNTFRELDINKIKYYSLYKNKLKAIWDRLDTLSLNCPYNRNMIGIKHICDNCTYDISRQAVSSSSSCESNS